MRFSWHVFLRAWRRRQRFASARAYARTPRPVYVLGSGDAFEYKCAGTTTTATTATATTHTGVYQIKTERIVLVFVWSTLPRMERSVTTSCEAQGVRGKDRERERGRELRQSDTKSGAAANVATLCWVLENPAQHLAARCWRAADTAHVGRLFFSPWSMLINIQHIPGYYYVFHCDQKVLVHCLNCWLRLPEVCSLTYNRLKTGYWVKL